MYTRILFIFMGLQLVVQYYLSKTCVKNKNRYYNSRYSILELLYYVFVGICVFKLYVKFLVSIDKILLNNLIIFNLINKSGSYMCRNIIEINLKCM